MTAHQYELVPGASRWWVYARRPHNIQRLALISFVFTFICLAISPSFVAAANLLGAFRALQYLLTPARPMSKITRPPDAAAYASRGTCRWQVAAPAQYCVHDREADSPTFEAHELDAPILCPDRAHAQVCKQGDTRALLVGPFASAPGQWHSVVCLLYTSPSPRDS